MRKAGYRVQGIGVRQGPAFTLNPIPYTLLFPCGVL